VAVVPIGKIACATMLWRAKQRLHVTVVVKARFRFDQNDHMKLVKPKAVCPEEGELAPYLGQADVVLSRADAHVCGAVPSPVIATKLALYRDWAVIDKNLLVYAPGAGREHNGAPFTRAAMVQPAGSEPLGVVVNPQDPSRGASYGPLSAAHPARQGLLAGQSVPRSRDGVADIPDMFPWSFFQIAPADQRTSFLRGDEWVLLDGMDPHEPRLQSRLPSVSAFVKVYPPDLRAAQGPCYQVAMLADRLTLDVPAKRCTILWRGSFPVADINTARSLSLVAAVSVVGQSPLWPAIEQLLQEPILLERGLGAPPVAPPPEVDDMEETWIREDDSAPEAGQVAAEQAGAPVSRRLAMSSQGVTAVEVEQVSVDSVLIASQAPREKTELVPAELPGMPWSERQPRPQALSAAEEAGRAPRLAELSVMELRQKLSDSIDEDSCDELRWTLSDPTTDQ